MKNKLLILCLIPFCFACGPEFGTTYGKAYEFWVENQLIDRTIKIVPQSNSDFWLSPSGNYVAKSGEKVIIGSKVVYDSNKKASDLYQPDDVIAQFDVYINDVKQEKSLCLRKFWDFSLGKVSDSGKYTLAINENVLNN